MSAMSVVAETMNAGVAQPATVASSGALQQRHAKAYVPSTTAIEQGRIPRCSAASLQPPTAAAKAST